MLSKNTRIGGPYSFFRGVFYLLRKPSSIMLESIVRLLRQDNFGRLTDHFWPVLSIPNTSASGRGCVKTQNQPLEIVSRLGEFSVEVSCLLTGCYRLISQSIASHVVFEGDFWGETVPGFSHSLGRKRPIISAIFTQFERPLLRKAAVQELTLKNCPANVGFTPESCRQAKIKIKGRC